MIPEIESVSCVIDSISSRFSRVRLRMSYILRPTGESGRIISGMIASATSASRQSRTKIVTTVVTIVKTLVTIETSVPVTTLSMLSTSLETRFMISPVFVPVKNESGMRCRCATRLVRMSRMIPSPTSELR